MVLKKKKYRGNNVLHIYKEKEPALKTQKSVAKAASWESEEFCTT